MDAGPPTQAEGAEGRVLDPHRAMHVKNMDTHVPSPLQTHSHSHTRTALVTISIHLRTALTTLLCGCVIPVMQDDVSLGCWLSQGTAQRAKEGGSVTPFTCVLSEHHECI